MSYRQILDRCFADAIGDGGVPRDAYAALLEKADGALEALRTAGREGRLPLLDVPAQRDDFDAWDGVSEHLLNNTSDIVVFGTGGSSLGAQALAQMAGQFPPLAVHDEGRPRVHFFDNPDPETMDRMFRTLDLRTTRFLVISKSGTTAETLAQTLATMHVLDAAGGGKYMRFHFAVVTEPGDNPLRRLAKRYDFPVLDHHPGIGGRYSVLTNVGLLPGHLMGLSPLTVREGAQSVLEPVLQGAQAADIAAAQGAALAVAFEAEGGRATVMMPYTDRLERFAMWYRQLWAESLGKQGHGTTPIRALGPVDQHSQLQLYLAGPRDKLFTVIQPAIAGTGPRIDAGMAEDFGLHYLAGRTIGDLVAAECRATVETLAGNGRPVRVIEIDQLNEYAMGALFMHFMLETMIAAHLLGVDAFDQPAVEQGKVLTREFLLGHHEHGRPPR